jgi:hypothetical protein
VFELAIPPEADVNSVFVQLFVHRELKIPRKHLFEILQALKSLEKVWP